jgi:bacterioferritin-associated ferredoxin
MIVCMCNGLREKACREVAANGQCRGVGCIYRQLGSRVRCGRCVPMMQEIYLSHAPQPASCAGCSSGRAIVATAAPER